MQRHRNLAICRTRCARRSAARSVRLIVYDMQVGVVNQLADGRQVTERVGRVLEAARRAGVRVFFTRHMTASTK